MKAHLTQTHLLPARFIFMLESPPRSQLSKDVDQNLFDDFVYSIKI